MTEEATLVVIKENEDGTSLLEWDTDEQSAKTAASVGLKLILYAVALGMSVDSVFKLLETHLPNADNTEA